MFKVTAEAARQILETARQSGADNMALRIAAKRDAGGGIDYGMGFDAERANDIQIISEGVTLLVSRHSEALLKGTVLDFVEFEPGDFRFIFVNPNDAAAAVPGDAGSPAAG